MGKKPNPTLVGAFVVISIALMIGGILLFGGGRFFEERTRWVSFFSGNVRGLQVGAPVTFRGVRVGEVTDIQALIDPETLDIKVGVFMDLVQGAVKRTDGLERQSSQQQAVEALIDKRGLRAQLALQSMVTGQLLVNLDFRPEHEPVYIGLDVGVPEVPAIPSDLEAIQNTLSEFVEKVRGFPIDEFVTELFEITTNLEGLVESLNERVQSDEVTAVLTGMEKTLASWDELAHETKTLAASTNELVVNVDEQLPAILEAIEGTVNESQATLEAARLALEDISKTTGPDSELHHELTRTLGEVTKASRAMRALAETIEEQPESVLWGKSE